jgi:hypothetical protein
MNDVHRVSHVRCALGVPAVKPLDRRDAVNVMRVTRHGMTGGW